MSIMDTSRVEIADVVCAAMTKLADYAADPSRSRGRLHPEPESERRSAFQRDRDRIIHSGAFRKLEYKTQVFVHHVGDYYRTRLTHSLEVAQIARSIARVLRLDEDLAEAIALAHDLGHTPFGHAGEDALADAMAPYGGFDHNEQALRVLVALEQRYIAFDGLNLSWEAVEGVVKHNGPIIGAQANGTPVPATIRDIDAAWDLDLAGFPSLEAQVAALSDDIAYNNHDIDDGVRAELISVDDLRDLPLVGPIVADIERQHGDVHRRRLIHELTRRLIGQMVDDVIDETACRLRGGGVDSADAVRAAGRPMVAFSDIMSGELQSLRQFLFQRIYRHPEVNRETSKARRLVRRLFDLFMAEPNVLPLEWTADAQAEAAPARARLVADYIAGMTDRYAVLEYRRLFVPGNEM